MNHRLACQLIVLCVLIVLPVSMIAINGRRAVQAILNSDKPQGSEDAAHAEVPADDRSGSRVSRTLQFGVYDPQGVFPDDKELTIRHLYVSWSDFEPDRLAKQLSSLSHKGFEILLTVEPWPKADIAGPLLPAITEGKYDAVIDQVAGAMSSVSSPIYVSWGHEMDQDLTQRYPWSGKNPQQFVEAYRYVVNRLRQQVAAEVRWVWAGVLKDGSLNYWPGEDFVDFIGFPIYSFPEWDQQAYGYIRDFRTIFADKQRIVAGLDKPLMITEMGVSGSDDFENFWLRQAFLELDDFPNLEAVVFFYSRDTEHAWGNNVATPDWKVHPEAIRGLVSWKLHERSRNSAD